MYASVKDTNIGSDNGLLPTLCQDIIWTNVVILSIRPQGTYFSEILFEIRENTLEMAVCEMAAILSRPQCVNSQIPGKMGITVKKQDIQRMTTPGHMTLMKCKKLPCMEHAKIDQTWSF